MPIKLESQFDTQSTILDDLRGEELKDRIKVTGRVIEEVILSTELNSRGFLLLINGPWGAGKTSVAWALINHLEEVMKDNSSPFFIFRNQSSLLPFGNSSESIRVHLTCLAEELWKRNIFDVRHDIKRFIMELTPADEGSYALSASMGPFSVAKSIPGYGSSYSQSFQRIRRKFLSLSKDSGCIVVVLDELDRLRPTEIVSILRLAEQLRQLPRVIVILPVYKKIASSAFAQELRLDNLDADTFMRKFSDFELGVKNGLSDLKDIFIKRLIDSDVGFDKSDVSTLGGLWMMLLSNIVLSQAVKYLRDPSNNDKATNPAVSHVFVKSYSKFLTDLRDHIVNSRNSSDDNDIPPRPVLDDDGKNYVRLGDKSPFNTINSPDSSVVANVLEGIMNNDDVLSTKIFQNQEIYKAVRGGRPTPSNLALESSNDKTFLTELIVPLIEGSNSELSLTDYYRARDIIKMAELILVDDQVINVTSKNGKKDEGDRSLKMFRIARNAVRHYLE